MFAKDVGLICLDEPTVGLDSYNIAMLGSVFNKLKEITRTKGLQVVLVTHEKSLAPLFDNQITLS
jgi:ABC-type lipoprotein export system ATPase subunit